MSLTGTLRIGIELEGGSVASVQIEPADQVPVGRLLAGLTPDAASTRLKMLFSICGNAHAVAALMAGEAITGTAVSEQVQRTRSIIIAAEALREHTNRILFDWAQLCGLKPDIAALKTVSDAFRSVQGAAENRQDISALAQTTFLLAKSVRLAMDPEKANNQSLADCHLPSHLIAKIRTGQITGAQNDPVDGTVYGRRWADPHVSGEGVERRVRARLIETEMLCDWLGNPEGTSPLNMSAIVCGSDRASVNVEVARGLLIHDMTMEGGHIKHYRISAPTTANFAPGGAAEAAIRSLAAVDRRSLEWLAKLSVLEVDPCVAHEVRIS